MALELVASSSVAAPAVTAAQIEHTNSINADLRREIAALSGGAAIAAVPSRFARLRAENIAPRAG